MKRITPQSLEQYLHDDWVMTALDRHSSGADESLTAQRWLRQSAAKRHVFSCLYADLLRSESLRVVDVGGGLSAFTRALARRHDYCLIDIMAHGAPSALCGEAGRLEIRAGDWYEQGFPADCDVIVANDLFPNVDQRLAIFLERALPCCRELRLSLTFFDEPRFYLARRLEADEVLCMLSWSGADVARALEPHARRLPPGSLAAFDGLAPPSIFPNRRQVCVGTFQGDIPSISGAGAL